nr:hypothetical protein [Sphingomonas sp. CDS-1]
MRASDCQKLIDASLAAWSAGMPLNRFITIAWGRGGVPGDEAVEATGQFIRLAREWMRARGYQMPWAWVQERGIRFGQHVHILLHVPADLDPLFRPMPLRWTKSNLPNVYTSGVVQTQRLKFAATMNVDAYSAELQGKLHYMLKCAPAEMEATFGLFGHYQVRWGQRCLVIGKRSGVWQDWKKMAIVFAATHQTAPFGQHSPIASCPSHPRPV